MRRVFGFRNVRLGIKVNEVTCEVSSLPVVANGASNRCNGVQFIVDNYIYRVSTERDDEKGVRISHCLLGHKVNEVT